MKPFIKAASQSILRPFGLELRSRNQPAPQQFVPYVREFAGPRGSFRYWVTSPLYGEWYDQKLWAQSPETTELARIVRPGDRILEIGANIGFTTCLLATLAGPSGRVTAVELVPANCLAAQAQVALNGFHNVEVLQFAASDKAATLHFENKENGEVIAEMAATAIHRSGDVPPVVARPCDELLPTHGPFDLVKIDCEGFESRVLRGCRSILESKPRLVIEIHGGEMLSRHGSSVEEVLTLVDAPHYAGRCWIENETEARDFELSSHPRHLRSHVFISPCGAEASR